MKCRGSALQPPRWVDDHDSPPPSPPAVRVAPQAEAHCPNTAGEPKTLMPPSQLLPLQRPSDVAARSGTRSAVRRTAAPAQQPAPGSRGAGSGAGGSLQAALSLSRRTPRSSKARKEELLNTAAQQAPKRRRHSAPQMQQATSPAVQAAMPASAAKPDRVKGRVELSMLGQQPMLDGRRRIKPTVRFEAVPSHVHNRLQESRRSAAVLRGAGRRSSAPRAQSLR